MWSLVMCMNMSEGHLGKRFQGQTPYTIESFERDVIALSRHFFPNKTLVPPLLPLLIAAQYWDATFIAREPKSRKILSLFWTDGQDYLKWWTLRSEEWAGQLAEGEEDWPTWFKNDDPDY